MAPSQHAAAADECPWDSVVVGGACGEFQPMTGTWPDLHQHQRQRPALCAACPSHVSTAPGTRRPLPAPPSTHSTTAAQLPPCRCSGEPNCIRCNSETSYMALCDRGVQTACLPCPDAGLATPHSLSLHSTCLPITSCLAAALQRAGCACLFNCSARALVAQRRTQSLPSL
jgi:hypothetical protein